jgi:hypothetical protein
MLRHEMEVRKIGLNQFGLKNVPDRTPLSLLEAKLLPLYLHHRYQMQAAIKSIGGLYYTYAVKVSNGPSPVRVREIVAAARQRQALDAVLDTLTPESLAVPENIIALIPPRAYGYEGGPTELFEKRTDPVFDPIGAATIAADLAIAGLLEPRRAARLISFHSENRLNPDFKEILDSLIARTWRSPVAVNSYHAVIARAVQSLTVAELIELAANADASAQVRAEAVQSLRELRQWLKQPASRRLLESHRQATIDDIERFLRRPDVPWKPTPGLATPPGDPIGQKNGR